MSIPRLLPFMLLWSVSVQGHSECEPLDATYRCLGGLCAVARCPPGPKDSLRACGEAYYAANLEARSGKLSFQYESGNQIRYTANNDRVYNSIWQVVTAATDCPTMESNLGRQACAGDGGPVNGALVNTVTGNRFQSELDYSSAGPFPLIFERFYNSDAAGSGRLGSRWRHSFDRTLSLRNGISVKLVRADGKVLFFSKCGTQWCGAGDSKETLSYLLDASGYVIEWQYRDSLDTTEIYDGGGRLLMERSREGLVHLFVYDRLGRIIAVRDDFGKQLTLAYDSAGRLTSLGVPGGGSMIFAYGAAGALSSVTYPDATSRQYRYDEPGLVAAGASSSVLLTGILDKAGIRRETFRYDGSSRAIADEHACEPVPRS